MNEQKNIRVIFTNKADLVFAEIIAKYNLKETEDEIIQKLQKSGHSRTSLIKKIIIAFTKDIISNDDLETSLTKILKIDQETIKIISRDIIKNLVPLLEKFPDDKFNDPAFREEVSKKIFGDTGSMPLLSGTKKISVADVEKNAEQIQKTKKFTEEEKEEVAEDREEDPSTSSGQVPLTSLGQAKKLGENKFADEKKGPDTYREPIE